MSKYDKYQQFIFVCKDKDCKKAGAKEIEKAFEKGLKNHKLNKSTKLLECLCTGRCKEAPVAIVGNQWLAKLKPEDVDDLLEKF